MQTLRLGLLVATTLALIGCAKVESGHGGVLWTAWSGTQLQTLPEGWHTIAPWNNLYRYDLRTQDMKEDLHVLANNGLTLSLEVSVRFRPIAEKLAELHQTVGSGYYEVLLAPALRSEARKVGGRYSPEEIYSTKRAAVEQEIFEEVKRNMVDRPVMLETIFIRNVDLPEKLKVAINEKLEEEQRALKMKYTLDREREEAKRKEIEAHGISERNRIISESMNDKLLQYEGIQATERLALSPNAKVVVVGSGKNGLPLILGGQ